MPPEPRPADGRDAPQRGVRLTFRYGADPKRAAEALVELLLSKRRHAPQDTTGKQARRPGDGAGDKPPG